MNRAAVVAVFLVVMIALIIGADVVLFRHHFWPRLLANIGIVLVFAALYLRFRGRS